MDNKNKKALVIGSGIAGIASAIRLANLGYEVTVFEINNYPGGKLSSLQLGAYRFDTGPSLFTMPKYVEELFLLSGKKTTDYFEYHTCETSCHYFFEDGTFLPFPANKDELFKVIEEILQIDSTPLKKHLDRSEFIYNSTKKTFLEKSLHQFKNYFSLEILKTLFAVPFLNIFSTMHRVNKKRLNHPKLVQIFDRYATYNGSNPYLAPGILNIIPHFEFGIGTYFPKKGMHSITTSLVSLAEDLGVKFQYNSRVQEIVEEGNTIIGIKVNDVIVESEIVFCNSDIKPAYTYLLKNIKANKKTINQEPSSSAMIFYWGINKTFNNLDLHNIFFSQNYKSEFDAIFKNKTVSDDPTVYIHISSKYNETDAPDNHENWFVMVNVPSNSGQNWNELRQEIRKNIIKKLSFILKEDIEKLIVVEDYLDPVRIEKRTSSFAGALYGASSNKRMAAFFRHSNFSKINGLYFVGGSVHPGGGIPLCLLSAKIATSEISKI